MPLTSVLSLKQCFAWQGSAWQGSMSCWRTVQLLVAFLSGLTFKETLLYSTFLLQVTAPIVMLICPLCDHVL